MPAKEIDICPDCRVALPYFDGPAHPYVGASPACWALFAALVNAGEPPLAPAPLNGLIADAYMAQHPGVPSDQAIQSVAVHLLALYGVLVRGVAAENVLWIRRRALRDGPQPKHRRFHWLNPPSFEGSLTIAGIVQEATPQARADRAVDYVGQLWTQWASQVEPAIAGWYEAYVLPDRL